MTYVPMNLSKRIHRNAGGFTLVELLVVIAVLGLLGGMFTLAYRGAQQEAFSLKTRTTVQKISNVLLECVDTYSQEPIGWPFPTYLQKGPMVTGPITRSQLIEQTRLIAIRDRLRLEMPDHPDDIKWTTSWVSTVGASPTPPASQNSLIVAHLKVVGTKFNTGLINWQSPTQTNPVSSRAVRLLRKLSEPRGDGVLVPKAGWELSNANAELLYLIVEDAIFDGSSAIELFGASEVGDTDGDGLKEFLDAFGRPIAWIRWPAGYPGALSAHPDPLDPLLVRGAGDSSRLSIGDEPYDLMGVDPGRGTELESGALGAPLVISAGYDGLFGVRLELDAIPENRTWLGRTSKSVADTIWQYGPNSNIPSSPFPFADPWYPRDNPAGQLGTIINSVQASDNIANLDGNAASL